MNNYNIHSEVYHLTERLYKLERDTRAILEEKNRRIAELTSENTQLKGFRDEVRKVSETG